MNLTVSRPVKILVLVLVVAGVGGIASLSMLGKSSPASTSTLSVAQIRDRAHGGIVPATTAPAAATTTAPAAASRTAAPAVKPKPKPKPAQRAPERTVTASGLPLVLAAQLREHPIVVVSVFDPQAPTDAVSFAEARAGAADAGVGFLGVSALDNAVASPLTALVPGGGLLPLPGILIFRRPATLVELVDGFVDRGSVAALALNARTAAPYSPPASTTTTPAAPAPTPVPSTPTDTTSTTG